MTTRCFRLGARRRQASDGGDVVGNESVPGLVVGELEMLLHLGEHPPKLPQVTRWRECFQPRGEVVGNRDVPLVPGFGDVGRDGDGPGLEVDQLCFPACHALDLRGADAGEVGEGEVSDHGTTAPAVERREDPLHALQLGGDRPRVLLFAHLPRIVGPDSRRGVLERERPVRRLVGGGAPREKAPQVVEGVVPELLAGLLLAVGGPQAPKVSFDLLVSDFVGPWIIDCLDEPLDAALESGWVRGRSPSRSFSSR